MADAVGIFPIPEPVRAHMLGRSFRDDPRCPPFEALRLVRVLHVSFEGATQQGELIVHESLAEQVRVIFGELHALAFPIASMKRIDHWDADDERSMAANNSSAFNFRVIQGTDTLSRHALGRAVDINPMQNPWLRGERVDPEAGRAYLDRAHVRAGMIVANGPVVAAFKQRGWSWGGR
jgi:poly-gamma-glutamate synthesis protein (capsule biosynthesis protein)